MPTIRFSRRQYLVAAAAFFVFAAYGSLVPFSFHPVPFPDAVARFRALPYLELGIESRADFVANILLFVPLGYLLVAGLRTDRRRLTGHILIAIAVVAVCVTLAFLLEFIQIYFPPRTTSQNDVIAESAGAILGAVTWIAVGPLATEWLRRLLQQRGKPSWFEGVLFVYCAAFLISQLMPFDLTINLGQLAEKYRAGRIEIVPFSHTYSSLASMTWDLTADVMLNAPLGMAASVLVGYQRRWVPVLASSFIVGSVELAQVFVYSRYASVSDVIVGSVGTWCGAEFARRQLTERGHNRATAYAPHGTPGGVIVARLAFVCFGLFLVAYQWYPFDFSLDANQVKNGLGSLYAAPFTGYYFGTEFNGFTQGARKFLFGFLFGLFARASFPGRSAWLVVLGTGLFLSTLELGQILLADRIADVGDVIVGVLGIGFASWLSSSQSARSGKRGGTPFEWR